MWLTALKASWRQNFIMATRYLFNMLSGIITMYIVFLLMFYGVKAVGAGAFDPVSYTHLRKPCRKRP